jgi:hypothetical protein
MFRVLPAVVLLGAVNAFGELVWQNSSQEFQRTPEDRELVVNYAFRNDGKAPITIVKVTSSCGCTTAELAKKTYQPGEAGNLPARFIFGSRRGPQAKSVAVTTDDQKTTQLSFKCLIFDDVLSLSRSLVYWKVGDTGDAKQVDLTIGQTGKVNITAVASTNPRIAATLATVKDGENYKVIIRPTDTTRPESAEIFVQTDFPPEGPKAYTIHVRIK